MKTQNKKMKFFSEQKFSKIRINIRNYRIRLLSEIDN